MYLDREQNFLAVAACPTGVKARLDRRVMSIPLLVVLGVLIDAKHPGPRPKLNADQRAALGRLVEDATFAVFVTFGGGARPVGILTLYECAAVYALGRFGEISELYVAPE